MFRRLLSALSSIAEGLDGDDKRHSSDGLPPGGMIDRFSFWDTANPHRAPVPYPLTKRAHYEVNGPIGKAIFVAGIIALGLAMIFL